MDTAATPTTQSPSIAPSTAPIALAQSAEVDLHRLDLRFADARLIEPRAIAALARSIEVSGQLVACIAVAVPETREQQLILVDGYRRVQALRRLGRDTATVESWSCDLAQALLRVLAQSCRRPFAALEEALLVHELVRGQGLSQREVAQRSGRDVSWVSRRLQLLLGLSDRLRAAVREGQLSTWAATRILAPLARANSTHADQLLVALAANPLSTRDLQTWFAHYPSRPQAARDQMVAHPQLFIESLRALDEQTVDTRLRAGPEGQCAADVRQLLALIRRLRQRLPGLPPALFPESLAGALSQIRCALEVLQSELARSEDHEHVEPDPRCSADPASPRQEPARHQPCAEAVA